MNKIKKIKYYRGSENEDRFFNKITSISKNLDSYKYQNLFYGNSGFLCCLIQTGAYEIR